MTRGCGGARAVDDTDPPEPSLHNPNFEYTGRLHQVEYAIEAINNAGTCVGILCKDGIVLAAERKTTSKLLAPSKTSDKIYQIDGHISAVVAGLTSDANILINQARCVSRGACFCVCPCACVYAPVHRARRPALDLTSFPSF